MKRAVKDNVAELKKLHSGGELDIRTSGITKLREAIRYQKIEIIKFLIEIGVDINAENNDGDTALHLALVPQNNDDYDPFTTSSSLEQSKVDEEIVKLLIAKGANVNARNNDGDTPLHKAVDFCNNATVIKLLIDNGANLKARNDYDLKPYDLFEEDYNDPEIKEMLKPAGKAKAEGKPKVKPAASNENSKKALKSKAIIYITSRDIEGLEQCIKDGLNVNEEIVTDKHALHIAARNSGDNTEIIKFLIGKGANVNQENSLGNTPLIIAAREGDKELVSLLLANGAKVKTPYYNYYKAFDLSGNELPVSTEINKLIEEAASKQTVASEAAKVKPAAPAVETPPAAPAVETPPAAPAVETPPAAPRAASKASEGNGKFVVVGCVFACLAAATVIYCCRNPKTLYEAGTFLSNKTSYLTDNSVCNAICNFAKAIGSILGKLIPECLKSVV